MTPIEFYFDFTSPYDFLAAMPRGPVGARE